MLQTIGRFFMGLLLGILIGAGGVWWLMSSGAADFMLRTSHYVQDLERRVEELGDQRAGLARQLEGMEGRLSKMAEGYETLERRFRDLAGEKTAETPPPAAIPQQAPGTATPRAGSAPHDAL